MGDESRLMPQDRYAEQQVLSAMLNDAGCIDEVAGRLGAEDFYFAEHQFVYRAAVAMAERQVPVDAAAVFAHLRREGRAEDVTAAYLAEVVVVNPTGFGWPHYAEVVRDAARRRRLIHLCTEMARDAWDGGESSADLAARFEQRVFEVATGEGRAADESVLLEDAMRDALASMDARARGDDGGAIPTGFPSLDAVLGGLKPGQLVVVAARPGVGKAQPDDEPVLTPGGWVPIGSLQPGDRVVGSDGRPTAVIAVHPQGELDCFEVSSSDGGRTRCCGEHLWFTQSRYERRRGVSGSVKTTAEIAGTLRRPGGGRFNHRLPTVGPVEFNGGGPLPIDPYLLGLLLGDGSFGHTVRFYKPEVDLEAELAEHLPPGDVVNRVSGGMSITAAVGRDKSATARAIEAMGLAGLSSIEKFIPPEYLFAPVEARRRLIQGLFNTDGHMRSDALCEYATSSPMLAEQVEFVCRSLGGIVRRVSRVPTYSYLGERRKGQLSWRLFCRFPDGWVPVSSDKHTARREAAATATGVMWGRMVDDVRPAGRHPCRCISVAAADGLYVTRDFLVTHNTATALCLALNVVARPGGSTLFFSQEMAAAELAGRALAVRASVPLHIVLNGKDSSGPVRQEQIDALIAATARSPSELRVIDRPHLSAAEAARAVRQARRRHGVKLVIVDYAQRMHHDRTAGDSLAAQIGHTVKAMKTLAREAGVPILLLAQLNRDAAAGEPLLSHLKSSGDLEQEADVVVLLHSDPPQPGAPPSRVQKVKFIIAKHRNGPCATVEMDYVRRFTRFEEPDLTGRFD